jgi:hypothetical protein
MQEMFPQEEPPTRSNTMKFVSSPITLVIATLVGTIIGAIISAVILGTAHIIDFSWIMLILGCLMLGILILFIWDNYRMRKQFHEQNNKDSTAHQAEWQQFKENWESFFSNERSRLDKWAISYAADREKEYKERYEELKRQCMEAIHGAELRLDVSMKNSMSQYKTAQETTGIIIDQYREQLIHEMRRLDAIEDHFQNKILSDKPE